MGKTFKVIRTLLDKDAGNNVSKSIDFVVNNTKTCDPKQISNSFNNYFTRYKIQDSLFQLVVHLQAIYTLM